MTLLSLPVLGSTAWYSYMQSLHGDVSALRVLPAPVGGGADDTTALQAAIDAAPARATLIAQPGASYSVSTLLVSAAGITLDFTGATVTQRVFSGVILRITGAGVTVRGGVWDGNRTNQSNNNNAIQVESNDATIADATVQNVKFIGIYNLGGNRFKARNCKVSNTGFIAIFSEVNTGAPAAYSDVVITGCTVDRSMIAAASIAEGGIKVKGMLASSLTAARISNCTVRMPTSPTDGSAIAIETTYAPGATISDNHTFGGAMGISLAACAEAIASGNRIFGGSDYGLEVAASPRATVTANTIDGNGVSTNGIMVNTASGVASTATTLLGNTVRNTTATPIHVQSSLNCVVVGNIVENGSAGGYLINVVLADGATVSGNTLNGLGTAPKALMIDTTSYVAVTGNVMRDCTQNAVFMYSTSAGYTISDIAITGNVAEGFPSAIDAVVSGGAVVGDRISAAGNAGIIDYPEFATRVTNFVGTGSPEGVWYAGIGSTYVRTDGGAGTSFYVKQTASTLNTGWAGK